MMGRDKGFVAAKFFEHSNSIQKTEQSGICPEMLSRKEKVAHCANLPLFPFSQRRDIFQFTSTDGYIEAIFERGQGTRPTRVIGTRGIVSVVEVEHDALPMLFTRHGQEIATLDSIEEITTTAITFRRAGGITEGQEETTTIDIEPVEG
jgi:hypothetical protein